VSDLCGIQAQDPFAATLAVWVRSRGLVAADVERARVHERSIVRTWGMRGTLHLLATKDLGWLWPLFGPTFVAKSRRRYAELGLNEEMCRRATHAMRGLLANQGAMTRAELAQNLSARGIPTAGQAAYHLVRRAALEGAICFGPDRDGEPTYVLLEDWVHTSGDMARDAARAELARRYLEAYGQAGAEDLAAWSGLSIREARAGLGGISDELIQVEMGGAPSWMLQSRTAWLDAPRQDRIAVRLLPSFDPYLLGYRSRALTVPQRYAKRVHPGGGVIRPTLLVDGCAAGTWKTERSRDGLVIIVESFEDLGSGVTRALEDQVQDLGRFLGEETALRR
jgi:hypothetical protein